MNNKFLKHFLVIGSGTLISMIIGFLTTPIITRVVTPMEYGQFSIFTMYSSIALMVLCLGLDQALVRYFYEKETANYRRALLFKCLKFPIIGFVITVIIILFLAFSGIFKFELGFSLLILLGIYTFIQIIYRFSQLLVRLQYKSKLYSMLGIIQKTVYVILALGMIYSQMFSGVMALTVATVIAALVCLIVSIVAEKNYGIQKKS